MSKVTFLKNKCQNILLYLSGVSPCCAGKVCLYTQSAAKAAFTLAEVLITLAIIGLVAALTIPGVIQGYRKKVVETKLVNFYSTINNAIALSEIDNGKVDTWDTIPDTNQTREEWIRKYLLPYLKNVELSSYDTPDLLGTMLTFPDGSYMAIWQYAVDIFYVIPMSGVKENTLGLNMFLFQFDPKLIWGSGTAYAKGKPIIPYTFGWDGTYAQLVQNCKQSGKFCTALIQHNSWKIPDDYPIKF